MSVKSVDKNPESLTMTVTAEFEATAERAWQLWADPRQLERWWGPPSHPATFVDHDLSPGGRVSYYMTSPEGEKFHGWWEVQSVDAPRRLEVKDGFGDDSGAPDDSMPTTRFVVTLEEVTPRHTVMKIESHFPSLEAMQQMSEMGMEEGITAAVNQIDAILADTAA